MALSDLYNSPSMTLGETPYSAQYIQDLFNSLAPVVQNTARRAAQDRGIMYSGPAMDTEVEAEKSLLSDLAQTAAGAQTQEALQQQQIQANKDITQQQTRANLLGSALSGGGQAVGTLGGLYAMGKMNKGEVPFAGAMSTQIPGASYLPGGTAPAPMLPGGTAPTSAYTGTNLAGGALSGLVGHNLGQSVFGGSTAGTAGSAAGGLGGLMLGNYLAPGLGGVIGSGLGAFAGQGLGNLFKGIKF